MNFEEELLQDAQEDAFIVSYVQQNLPQEVAEKFTEEDLYYILDVAEEYFAESGVLEAESDKDGYVEVDLEAAANYIKAYAQKEQKTNYDIEDLELILEAQLSYGETEE